MGALSCFASKNRLLRVARSIMSLDGTFFICIMYASWSYSFSPGNKGYPQYSSASMQPNDHISIAEVYGMPSMISGAR